MVVLTGCPGSPAGPGPDTAAPKETGGDPKPDTATPTRGDAAAGAEIYGTYCVACHGPEGRGGSGLARDFRADPTPWSKSDAALVKSIREGVRGPTGEMPSWAGVVSEDEAYDVVAYLRATFN